ncbi:tail fiber protein [Providencia rettgeri]|nr:tail fiber protein [Providencia rettgeri]
MAKNEFLPFGIAEGANVLSNQEYERLAARFNGFASGVAKSQELNTVWRQSSVISSSLAQFIVDSDNKDLLDNGDIAGIKNRLVAAIKQTISGVGYVTTAEMNLELNKKFDKANISGQKGNDNDKVPSLNLFTTETGKLATKAELSAGLAGKQPAGNYATITELNTGLDNKIDKSGGTVLGNLYVNGMLKSNSGAVRATNEENNAIIDLFVNSSGKLQIRTLLKGANVYNYHDLPDVSGGFMQIGDFGWGGVDGVSIRENDATLSARFKNKDTPTQVIKNSLSTTMNHGQSTIAYFKSVDTFLALSAGYHQKGEIKVTAGNTESHFVHTLYTDRNTSTDRNGYLRTSSATTEMQGVPIGSSVIWNTSAPIPDNFWPNEGRAFSASEYPELAKVYPTLKLPDDRGYAIRMADNGRGVDVGRTVGTYQEDAIQNIVGEFRATISGSAGGAFSYRENNYPRAVGAEQTSGIWTFDASRVVRTANETRMKNVAKILITRVK